MPSEEADELALLATLTALALARGRDVIEIAIIASFLTAVADIMVLVAAVIEAEEDAKTKQEEAIKEKEEKKAGERLEALEKAVKELKELCQPAKEKK